MSYKINARVGRSVFPCLRYNEIYKTKVEVFFKLITFSSMKKSWWFHLKKLKWTSNFRNATIPNTDGYSRSCIIRKYLTSSNKIFFHLLPEIVSLTHLHGPPYTQIYFSLQYLGSNNHETNDPPKPIAMIFWNYTATIAV